MSTITSAADIEQRLMAGKGMILPYATLGAAATAAAGASGQVNVGLNFSLAGTSFPATLVSLPLPAGSDPLLLVQFRHNSGNTATGGFLVRLYKIGSVNLAATGDQFTHHSATFPVTRSNVLSATDPVAGHLVVYVTTSTATTAPQLKLKTAAGGAGYVDDEGNSVVGTKTMTFPAAATAAGSAYLFPINDEDGGVRDVTQVEVTVAASAGAADLYLMEILCAHGSTMNLQEGVTDLLWGPLDLPDLRPAVATSGTAVSLLAVTAETSGAGSGAGMIMAVKNA